MLQREAQTPMQGVNLQINQALCVVQATRALVLTQMANHHILGCQRPQIIQHHSRLNLQVFHP